MTNRPSCRRLRAHSKPTRARSTDCADCPTRTRCTRAQTGVRNLTLQPRAEHEAIQAARQRQQTTEFATQYAPRAGIAGTLAQGIWAFGLRKARYRGLAKTHVQHIATTLHRSVQRGRQVILYPLAHASTGRVLERTISSL
jgi:hypothetical protein